MIQTPSPSSRNSLRERLLVIVGSVWLLAFYFLCRPYRGVRHDAQLYFAQAQLHLTPEWMSHDLFFLHGSQDRYSIFSALFAPLLKTFGLAHAEIGALLVLHFAFWIAVFLLVRNVPSPMRWGMLAVAAVMPHFYGAVMTFSFTEPFLTARTLAEPFCVLALAAFVAERWRWVAICLSLALIAHPLIALPVWVIAWYLLWERDRRWAWAGVVLLVFAAVAGWMDVAPFDGLFKRYDAAWFEKVHAANAFNFFYSWTGETWAQAFLDLSLLAITSVGRDIPLRRLYRASAITTLVLCAVSGILGDGFHLILPTQLQLWRSLWFAHLLALLALLPCAQMLWKIGRAGQLAAAAMLLATVIVYSAAQTSIVFSIAAVVLAVLALRGATLRSSVTTTGILVCAMGAVIMGLIQGFEDLLLLLQGVHTGMALDRVVSIPAAISQFMLFIAWIALISAARSKYRWALPASLCTGLALTVFGASQWDQRDTWGRYVESQYGQPNPFHVDLPPTAQVYWPNEMLASWVLLQRPAYATLASQAAAVFIRDSALEIDRRWKTVLPMTIQIEDCIKLVQAGRANFTIDQCKYTDKAIRDTCRSPGGPDNVVLMNPLQAPAMAIWNYQPPGRAPEPFYLYDCHSF